MRAVIVALALAATPAAAQRCLVGCDSVTTGAEAASQLEAWLGRRLPEGSRVEHLVEGGFQDAFIRARLDADTAGYAAVLGALGLGKADLEPVATPAVSEDEPDWWDWKLRDGVRTGEGRLPALPNATLYAVPSVEAPGRWTLYLWAFQT